MHTDKLRKSDIKLYIHLSSVYVLFSFFSFSYCHGRLIEPPGRSTAWRYGFDTPVNVDDNALYCGGFTRQWKQNGGRCGTCGDPYDDREPRENEAGGRYGQGKIVRTYDSNAAINFTIEITANHKGHFEFRLCPTNSASIRATPQCFERHLLYIYGSYKSKLFIHTQRGFIHTTYRLPRNVVCSHCVVQWRYIAGNNWGVCPNGTGKTGCGPQEEFRACADIQIRNSHHVPSGNDDGETDPDGMKLPLGIVLFLLALFLLFLLVIVVIMIQKGKKKQLLR